MRKGLQLYLIITGVFVLLAAGIFFTFYQPEPVQAPVQEQAQVSSEITLVIKSDDKEWRYAPIVNESILLSDVLLGLDESTDDFTLSYTDYGGDLGIFIESINGVGDEGSKWWQYWVNGEYAMVGVSQQMVAPGDLVEFRFTDQQYEE